MEKMKLAVSELMKKHEPLLFTRTPSLTMQQNSSRVEISAPKKFSISEPVLTKYLYELVSRGFSDALAKHAASGNADRTAHLDLSRIPKMIEIAQKKKAWKDEYDKPELHPNHKAIIAAMGRGAYMVGSRALKIKR